MPKRPERPDSTVTLTADELSALICACQAAEWHGARPPWPKCGRVAMKKLEAAESIASYAVQALEKKQRVEVNNVG